MEIVLSIEELKGMIKAIKTDNPIHEGKKIDVSACGIFLIEDEMLKGHRHITESKFKRINLF